MDGVRPSSLYIMEYVVALSWCSFAPSYPITTFSIIHNELGRTPSIPDETQAGEFYLDTIAVLPEYRGTGIGRQLITAIRDKAFSQGHSHVGLIVDFDNPRAEALYTSLGFARVGTKIFLDHKMWHMQSIK